ncbi:hypothetical protein PFISCL1PPCAC_5165, partial [Pristionchus fissidentatus]
LDGVVAEEWAGVDVARLVRAQDCLLNRRHLLRIPVVRLVPARLQAHKDLFETRIDHHVIRPHVDVKRAQMLGNREKLGRHLDHHILVLHILLHIADLPERVEIGPREDRVEIHPHEKKRPYVVLAT